MKIPRKSDTSEFKEQSVKRVRDGQSVGAVAKALQVVEQTLRNGVKAASAGALVGTGSRPVSPEATELSRLRAENARLKCECEILERRRTSQRMCWSLKPRMTADSATDALTMAWFRRHPGAGTPKQLSKRHIH